MTQKKTTVLIALLLLLIGKTVMAATAMPSFSLASALDGKEVSSKEFKGQVLLVSFFATWCPPCRQEIPVFIELQEKLRDKKFSILGLSVDEGGANIVKKLVETEKINYPILMADKAIMKGFGGVAGIPTSFLVNRKGNVVKSYPGYIPHALLEKDIAQVMEKSK